MASDKQAMQSCKVQSSEVESSKTASSERVRSLLAEFKQSGSSTLSEVQAQELLKVLGVPVIAGDCAQNVEQALQIARTIGYPVVLKILSPDIQHKSDVGGVKTGIDGPQKLESAWYEMMETVSLNCPEARLEGALVQEQAEKGIELILGAIRDPQFGPVVMVGLGGVYAEVFSETSFRMAPVSIAEANDMIASTRLSTLLSGVRGAPPVDIDFIASIVVRVGEALLEFDELSELEINPLVAWPGDRGVALDALVTFQS